MAIIRNIDPLLVARHVTENWERLKDARRNGIEEQWVDAVLCYLGAHPSKAQEWLPRAKKHGFGTRHMELVWDATENVVGQMCDALFEDNFGAMQAEPSPAMEGRADFDDELAKMIREQMQYFIRIMNTREELEPGFRQIYLTGNLPWTCVWYKAFAADYPAYQAALEKYDAESRQQWAAYQQTMQQWQLATQIAQAAGIPMPPRPATWSSPTPPVVDRVIAFSGPKLKTEDIFNFVMDDDCEGGHPLRIKRTWTRLAWLKRHAQRDETGYALYENLENVQEVDLQPGKSRQDDYLEERAAAFGIEIPPKRGVEILEAQGDMIIDASSDQKVFLSYIATIANGGETIRWEPTYLWSGECPTNLARLIIVPGQTYGMGIGSKLTDLSDLASKTANQTADSVDVACYPEFKAWDDGIFDPSKSAPGPGKITLVGDRDNMEPMRKDMTGIQVTMAQVRDVKAEFMQMSRSINPWAGIGSEETATETDRNTGIYAGNLGQIISQVENHFVIPALSLISEHIGIYGKSLRAPVTQNGKTEWLEVSPEAYRKGWLWKMGSYQKILGDRKQTQDLFMAIEMFGGNPLFASFLKPLDVMKLVWERLQLPGQDRIFIDGTPAEQYAMQMYQSILAQQAAAQQAMMSAGSSVGGLNAGVPADPSQPDAGAPGGTAIGGQPAGAAAPGVPARQGVPGFAGR